MAKDINDTRPSPEELLEKIKWENRGKLTVFLGAAAGVGKTYTMLEAAHERLREGVDVMIGWIETHGRQETEKMVAGLPYVPARDIEYKGKLLKEMDIDTILTRKPAIVLVDELAHTNIPGSRHVRRFQDVEELLNAGINVYTTLNVQHIESLNDIVAQITGVIVRETVPDQIVEQADHVQLIDIPPEELIKRLKEGKVYVPGQAERALKKFFRPGNINALREMALRLTAKRVDEELAEYMRANKIEGPWPAAGRVLVCISGSPFSAQLIRVARRLAGGLHAELLAVHVEAPTRRFPMGEKERDRVAKNLRLAEELGAKTITVVGEHLTRDILEVARTHNVTAIVVGKPHHNRFWEWVHGSLVDTLIHHSGSINVYVIQGTAEAEEAPNIKTAAKKQEFPWLHYAGGWAMLAAVTGSCWLLRQQLELVNIALLYLLPVLLTALWWGRWPSYATALAGVLAFDFLFVPPVFTFSVSDARYLWSFIIFLFVSFLIGGQTEVLRMEVRNARQRERSTRALYEFSRDIAGVVDLDVIAQGLVQHAGETFDRMVVMLMPDKDDRLRFRGAYSPQAGQVLTENDILNEAESAVAAWAYQHGQVTGRSTETLPGAQFLYIPLITRSKVNGILGVDLGESKITPSERRLVDAWSGLAAIALERVKLAEQAQEAALLLESDRLHSALFNSISHELRTPLSSIIGSVSTLLEDGSVYSEEERQQLLETIRDGSVRMERLVANLLDTARLESGMMKLKSDWCDIEDIIGIALRRLKDSTQQYIIDVELAPGLPLLKADCVLIEQVLVNLIDNAMKYSRKGSNIGIVAKQEGDYLKVTVQDQGVGIPKEDKENIFDKFYRVRQPKQVSGTGLGLSICKGIVEAHGGRIWAENRPGRGAALTFVLPVNYQELSVEVKAGE